MPIYVLRCPECDERVEVFRSIADIDKDLPECHGKTMQRVMCAPFVAADIQPYQSMVTGEMIDGRQKHREHLKRHNVVEVGNDLKPSPSPTPYRPAGGLKETIAKQVYEKLRY